MSVPQAVLSVVGTDAVWSRDHDGQSGNLWRTSGTAGSFFVKQGAQVAHEHHRLRWLTGRIPVAAIVAFTDSHDDPWLVLADEQAPSLAPSRTPALPAAPLTDPATVGTVMGQLLRRLHSLPIQECPFDSRIPVTVDQARKHVEADQVDPADFDDDHRHATPSELLDRLTARQPSMEDLVVTHGDFTPANVLIRPDRSPVLIDVAGLGVADRYRDLAIAHRDLSEDYGDQGIAAFVTAYGLASPLDPERQYWYRLLDEFF